MVGRYRKVEVRTWGDEKFRKLSAMPPSAQGLWLFLLSGPHTTAIPGVFRVGRAALAEELGWTPEAFDKAFAEVMQQGMVKADWINRVVWIPKAIKHNPPASPNVAKMWAKEFDLVPECELKTAAAAAIAAALRVMHPSYLVAFMAQDIVSKACGKSSGKVFQKPFGKASPMTKANQEQEQEQEQKQDEQETLALTANALPAAASFITLPLNDGSQFAIDAEQVCKWQGLYPAADVEQELRNYQGWADANPTRRKTRGGILRSVNSWLAKAHDSSANNRNGGVNGAHSGDKPKGQQRLERQVQELAKAGVEFPTK